MGKNSELKYRILCRNLLSYVHTTLSTLTNVLHESNMYGKQCYSEIDMQQRGSPTREHIVSSVICPIKRKRGLEIDYWQTDEKFPGLNGLLICFHADGTLTQ